MPDDSLPPDPTIEWRCGHCGEWVSGRYDEHVHIEDRGYVDQRGAWHPPETDALGLRFRHRRLRTAGDETRPAAPHED